MFFEEDQRVVLLWRNGNPRGVIVGVDGNFATIDVLLDGESKPIACTSGMLMDERIWALSIATKALDLETGNDGT